MSGTLEYQKMNENLLMADGHAMKAPEDYQNPEELYQVLVDRVRKYHPSADISMLEKAYQTAREAHKDQVRKSGEPYIIHPLWVGIILADLEMDKETIAAGILHDTVEDTVMTVEDVSRGVRRRGGASGRRGYQAGTACLILRTNWKFRQRI